MTLLAHIASLMTAASLAFGAETSAVQRTDGDDATSDTPRFGRHRLALVPFRIESGVHAQFAGGPAAYLGVGLYAFRLGRVSVEGNVAVDLVGGELQSPATRHVTTTTATVDLLVPVHRRVNVGGLFGVQHRSFRQSDWATWNQIVASNIVPVAGVRADLFVLRADSWGLALASRFQTELGQTNVVSDDGSPIAFSPFHANAGLRFVVGFGDKPPVDDAQRALGSRRKR